MANYTSIDNPCITLCKTPCKSRVNFRVFLPSPSTFRVKLHFPTHFSSLSHLLSHHPPTSVFYQFYPLFHRPYYYNYNY